MTFKVELTGADNLDNLFKKLPQQIQQKAQADAYRAGAKIMRDRAAELVPKKTGKLAKSIDIFTETKGQDSGSVYVSLSYKKGGWIGKFLEFGTSKMAAKPFMRPAFDQTKDLMKQEIKRVLALRIRTLVKNFKK